MKQTSLLFAVVAPILTFHVRWIRAKEQNPSLTFIIIFSLSRSMRSTTNSSWS
jgi:hypothetical protein